MSAVGLIADLVEIAGEVKPGSPFGDYRRTACALYTLYGTYVTLTAEPGEIWHEQESVPPPCTTTLTAKVEYRHRPTSRELDLLSLLGCTTPREGPVVGAELSWLLDQDRDREHVRFETATEAPRTGEQGTATAVLRAVPEQTPKEDRGDSATEWSTEVLPGVRVKGVAPEVAELDVTMRYSPLVRSDAQGAVVPVTVKYFRPRDRWRGTVEIADRIELEPGTYLTRTGNATLEFESLGTVERQGMTTYVPYRLAGGSATLAFELRSEWDGVVTGELKGGPVTVAWEELAHRIGFRLWPLRGSADQLELMVGADVPGKGWGTGLGKTVITDGSQTVWAADTRTDPRVMGVSIADGEVAYPPMVYPEHVTVRWQDDEITGERVVNDATREFRCGWSIRRERT